MNYIETGKSQKDKFYAYMEQNCLGKKNGKRARDIAKTLNMSMRVLRQVRSEINSDGKYPNILSTSGSCYMCENEEETQKALSATYKQAITLIKKARAMKSKLATTVAQ